MKQPKGPLDLFRVYDELIEDVKNPELVPREQLEALANFPLIQGKQAIYVIDWRKADVVYSRGVHEMLGYEEEEKPVAELIKDFHPGDTDLVHRIIQGAVNHFVDHRAGGEKEYLHLTYRLRTKPGRYILVLRQSSVLLVNKQGKPLMNLSYLTDISFISSQYKVEWDVYATELSRTALKKQVFKEFVDFFTSRQKEVVQCMARGMTNEEIARELHISKHTVGTHRKNILAKANCNNAQELIEFCRVNGIL